MLLLIVALSAAGQASRIPGVTPAALSLVHVSIRIQGKAQTAASEAPLTLKQ